ncbi:endonuclease/exonuclease/phosphatase family protein [Gulosibacter bifidus]|uniref:Endonuclease/exonuclease/phosphatase family protein n=1 Tax=Gulosibacter bifidus TaxID=272239 RepID=A0ABW5RGH1_9MICO|nr:endonuclease/exonuclease/phosphatase family protein [Gulosibacter bifidus]
MNQRRTSPVLVTLVASVLTAIAVGVGVLAMWPQLLGLHHTVPFAQAVPFRLIHLLVGAGVLLICVALAFALRHGGRAVFSVVSLAVAVVLAFGTLDLFGRGVALVKPPTGADDAIRVLAWNTLGNEPGSPKIAQLAADYDVDVLMLPETTEDMGIEIAAQLADLGKPMQVISGTGAPGFRAAETTLLVSEELGTYVKIDDLGDTSALATVIAEPADGDGPRLVAAHPLAPVPERMDTWKSDLEWVASICTGNTILAGDMNATIDHLSGLGNGSGAHLGDCRDAAVAAGAGAAGTWTSGKPPLLVAAIDHVMTTDQWDVTGFEVITREDRSGSDHRPVFAELSPAG